MYCRVEQAENPGPHEQELETAIDEETMIFKGHSLTKCPKSEVLSAKKKFIEQMISNIETRFPDTDLLSAFGILSMRPISHLSGEELEEWGNAQLETLLAHYGVEKTHKWKERKGAKSIIATAVVDGEATRKEWSDIKAKVVAQMYPRNSMEVLWGLIVKFHKDDCPNLIKLACLALTSPVNTAGCERGFSVQNQTLTSLRNRLSPETQDLLLRVQINGPPLVDFDFNRALKTWKQSSKKIFPKNNF